MKICKHCQHENSEGDLFCANCGKLVEEATENVTVEEVSVEKPSETERFCFHCGKPVSSHVKFCPECGVDLTGKVEVPPSEAKNEPAQEMGSRIAKTPRPRKNKWIIAGIIVAVLLSFGIYKVVDYYSEYSQLQRISDQLTLEKYDELIPLMVQPGSFKNYSKDEGKRFAKVLKDDKNIAAQMLSDINGPKGQGSLVKVVTSGKIMGIFKRSAIVVPSYSSRIKSNLKGGVITIDGDTKIKIDSDNFSEKTKPLIYGSHTFELSGEKDKQSINQKINQEVQLEETIDLNVSKINTMIVSNVDEADVYINNKKVGKLIDGSYDVTDSLWLNSMKFQLKRTLPDKTDEVSEIYNLDDPDSYSETINLDFEGAVTEEDLTEFLDSFYGEVTTSMNYSYSGLNAENKNALSRYFDGGKSNNEYLDFSEYIASVIKRIDDSDSDFERQVAGLNSIDSFERKSQDIYKVTYTVSYDTEYTYSSDRDNLEEVFRYTGITLKKTESDSGFKIVDMGGKDAMKKIN